MCYDFDFVNADSWTVRETIGAASFEKQDTIPDWTASGSFAVTPQKRAALKGSCRTRRRGRNWIQRWATLTGKVTRNIQGLSQSLSGLVRARPLQTLTIK